MAVFRLALLFALVLLVAGCAGVPQAPCSDDDPIGPCATSHSQTYDTGQ